jgi:predicted HicB family RNase H-like nuclease
MTERRRVGRPKEFDGTVSVRLPKDLHDALSLEALQRDRRLSQIIRERLAREYFVSQKSTKRQTSAY